MRWLLLPLQILATAWPAHAIVDTCDVCGRHPLVPRHDRGEQVVRRTDALPGAWPWIVSLQLPTITGHKHTCGGSLVSGRWVLTAAHCFSNKRDLPHWRAVVGAWKLSSLGSEVHVRYIKRIVIHEDYQRNTETSDIALMELDQPVKCSDYIQPACLPDTTVNVSLLAHCYISGWGILGKSAAREVSDAMHEVRVSRFSVAQCNSSSWYNGAIENHTMCAGYEEGGADICQGDSGGPLMCQEDGLQPFWIIGVTSWGQGCGKAHKPGVYTATQHFYPWIKQLAGPMPQPPPTPKPIPTVKILLQSESTPPPVSSPPTPVATQTPAHLPTIAETTSQTKLLVLFWPPNTTQAPFQPQTQLMSQSTSEVPPKPTSQLHAKSQNLLKVDLLQPETQAPSSPHAKPSPSSPTPDSLKAEVSTQTTSQVPPHSQAKPSPSPHSLKAEAPFQTTSQDASQSQAEPSSPPPPSTSSEVSIQTTSQVLSPSPPPPPQAEVLPEPTDQLQPTPLLKIEILSQPTPQAPPQPESASKTEVTSQLASTTQPMLQTPPQPKTKPLPEPEILTKVGSTSQAEPEPSPETESKPEPEAPTQPGTFQSASEAPPGSEPQPSPQTKSEPESETSSQLVLQTESEPQLSLQTESTLEPETPLPSTTLTPTPEASPPTSQPPPETVPQSETSPQPNLTSVSPPETQSPQAGTPSHTPLQVELEVPDTIEASQTDSTVAKFFRMIQEFLRIVKKEREAVWVWPKLSELKLIKDSAVASLKGSESPPAADLPAKARDPCKLKGTPSGPLCPP